MIARASEEQGAFTCPGYGNCAHVDYPSRGRGTCFWCQQHPGQPRPPVKARVAVEFVRIVRPEDR